MSLPTNVVTLNGTSRGIACRAARPRLLVDTVLGRHNRVIPNSLTA